MASEQIDDGDTIALLAGTTIFSLAKYLVNKKNLTIVLNDLQIAYWLNEHTDHRLFIIGGFGVHVLLNTHSPYFLRAVQVYSAKYEVAERCKYYLSEERDNHIDMKDVSSNIEKIYAKLSKPLQDLEDERWRDG